MAFKMSGWSPFKKETPIEGSKHDKGGVKVDSEKEKELITQHIKDNMHVYSDAEMMKQVNSMSDGNTEYNWNTETGEVESHEKKKN